MEEIKEDTIYLTNKLNQTVDKAENSIQHYELLFYEVGSLKKQLITTGKKINLKTIHDILIIKNPNDAIFLLMKMFYRIIAGTSLNANISWEIIQEKLTYTLYNKYLISLETNFKPLLKEELDDAMPFSINYEKIIELIRKFGNGMITILDFLKITVEYNIKTNIIKNLYSSNLNKNSKVNSLQNEITTMESIIKEASNCFFKMNEEYKELSQLKDNENKIFGIILIKRYKIDERYHILIELSKRKQMKPKYIIRLKAKYKERDNFINAIIKSRREYDEGKIQKIDQKTLNIILNSTYANSGDKYSFALDNNQPPKNRNGYNYFFPKNFLSCSDLNHMNQDCGYLLDNFKSYGSTGYKDSADEGGKVSCIKKLSIPDKGKIKDITEEINLHGAERTQRTKGTEKDKDDISNNDMQYKQQLKIINQCLNPIPHDNKEENNKPIRERNNTTRLPAKQIT